MIYFVSTPIGNMKDITLRALEVLKEVDYIACEDTRHSIKLLNFYDIKKKLISYHKFNEEACGEKIIQLALEGANIAVISDAGTPVVSDPGYLLVKRLIEKGIPFTAIPGANALLPALILSGMDASRFLFVGFLPEKNSERKKLLDKLSTLEATLIFYVAPHDIKSITKDLFAALGNRKAVIVKEITKLHEKRQEFTLSTAPDINDKGEFVILVEGFVGGENFEKLTINEHIALYIADGLTKMEAIKKVAAERGIPKSEIYKAAISDKN